MGSSPPKKYEITIQLNLDIKNLIKPNSNNLPPPPSSQAFIESISKDPNNKTISAKINFDNDAKFIKPSNSQEKENNELSLFNSKNIKEIINEKNDEININNKKKEKINILKEGVNEVTKIGEEKNVDNNNNNIITPEEGNKSNNIGANYQKNENGDNKGFNWVEKDLDLSQSVIMKDSQDILGQSYEMINKGYIPLLMKLDNFKPLFFFVKRESTLKSLVKAYIKNCPKTDEGIVNDIKLYDGDELLDINKPISELNLEPFCKINNKIADNKN